MWELPSLGIKNDAVSSIKVAPGYEIVIYEDAGYSGRRASFRSDVVCLSALEQSMDNILSSMEIRPLPVIFADPGELSLAIISSAQIRKTHAVKP